MPLFRKAHVWGCLPPPSEVGSGSSLGLGGTREWVSPDSEPQCGGTSTLCLRPPSWASPGPESPRSHRGPVPAAGTPPWALGQWPGSTAPHPWLSVHPPPPPALGPLGQRQASPLARLPSPLPPPELTSGQGWWPRSRSSLPAESPLSLGYPRESCDSGIGRRRQNLSSTTNSGNCKAL